MKTKLIQLLPEYFRPVLEFQEIMKADDVVLSELEENIDQIRKNLYIQTADEKTLSQQEALFKIFSTPGETIEYRRQRLIQKYNTIVPFSVDFLRDKLTELFGSEYTLEVDPVKCKVIISVTSSIYGALDLLYDLLWDVLPAHLEIISNQQVTSYISGNIYVGEIMACAFAQTI